MRNFSRCLVALFALAALAFAACSDDGSDSSTDTHVPDTGTTGTDAPPADEPLVILVSNDDGVDAEGIDVLVDALAELPDVAITVYAPATNQSGTGSTTSGGTVPTAETTTRSGYPAVAVAGTPADSVNAAFAAGVEPDVVVSGVNEGQNLGPITEVSGTVGAARTGAQNGVPAVAVSQGLGEPPDYEAGAEEAVTWITDNRDQLADGTAPVEVVNINVPTCVAGEVQEIVEVPLATEVDDGIFDPVDCSTGADAAADDIASFLNGYATLTVVSTTPTG